MTSDGNNRGNDSGNAGDNGGDRLAPRPISRPPVDPASRQAFGRPTGLRGSFVAERVRPPKFRTIPTTTRQTRPTVSSNATCATSVSADSRPTRGY